MPKEESDRSYEEEDRSLSANSSRGSPALPPIEENQRVGSFQREESYASVQTNESGSRQSLQGSVLSGLLSKESTQISLMSAKLSERLSMTPQDRFADRKGPDRYSIAISDKTPRILSSNNNQVFFGDGEKIPRASSALGDVPNGSNQEENEIIFDFTASHPCSEEDKSSVSPEQQSESRPSSITSSPHKTPPMNKTPPPNKTPSPNKTASPNKTPPPNKTPSPNKTPPPNETSSPNKTPSPNMTSSPNRTPPQNKTPPPGPYPQKHRPHVMDINYDPVLTSTQSRDPRSMVDLNRVVERKPKSRNKEQRSTYATDKFDYSSDEDNDSHGIHHSGDSRLASISSIRESHTNQEHQTQQTYTRTGFQDYVQPTATADTLNKTGEETTETQIEYPIKGILKEGGAHGNQMLQVPEIRFEKCSTGIASTASSPSLASASSVSYNVSISDSEEYDTELEEEFEKPERPPSAKKDLIAYETSCQKLVIPPQQVIYQSLKQSHLSLNYRNLGPLAIRALATALKSNREVSRLELSNTGLGAEGAFHVARMLIDNDTISHVNMDSNEIGVDGISAVSEMLCYNKGLITLSLQGNKVGEVGAEPLAVAIKNNNRLVELNISNNDFGEVGAVLLGQAIGYNEALTKLDMSWNHFRTKGAVAICKGLQTNTTLVEVDLSWNGLGYEGALALGNMLRANSTIRILDVSNNRINWQGALLLTKGIKGNTVLEELKVGCNPLTTTGALDIIQSVSDNTDSGITFLSLKEVPVVGEFEMTAMLICQEREFKYEHGGIVNTHDVVGQRFDKRIDPMQRVINFMKERELRVTELFRGLDKNVGNTLDVDEFEFRLRKAGIKMAKYEVEELIERIVGRETSDINVGKMMNSVKKQVKKERKEKIDEREHKKKIKTYHKKLLDDPNIKNLEDNLSDSRSQLSGISHQPSVMSGEGSRMAPASLASLHVFNPRKAAGLAPPAAAKPSMVLSMSGALGKKPKEFGTADIKKKKKKKRKGRK